MLEADGINNNLPDLLTDDMYSSLGIGVVLNEKSACGYGGANSVKRQKTGPDGHAKKTTIPKVVTVYLFVGIDA